MSLYKLFATASLALALNACSSGPEPLEYGKDGCAFCKMTISDNRFGAEIVTQKGKVYKYDAVECLLRAEKGGDINTADVEMYMVADLVVPGSLVEAAKARYFISEELPSPMGANISAFASQERLDEAQQRLEGDAYSWPELRKQFGL